MDFDESDGLDTSTAATRPTFVTYYHSMVQYRTMDGGTNLTYVVERRTSPSSFGVEVRVDHQGHLGIFELVWILPGIWIRSTIYYVRVVERSTT